MGRKKKKNPAEWVYDYKKHLDVFPKQLIKILKAFGNEKRLAILGYMVKERRPVTFREMMDEFNFDSGILRWHLRILEDGGLVERDIAADTKSFLFNYTFKISDAMYTFLDIIGRAFCTQYKRGERAPDFFLCTRSLIMSIIQVIQEKFFRKVVKEEDLLEIAKYVAEKVGCKDMVILNDLMIDMVLDELESEGFIERDTSKREFKVMSSTEMPKTRTLYFLLPYTRFFGDDLNESIEALASTVSKSVTSKLFVLERLEKVELPFETEEIY